MIKSFKHKGLEDFFYSGSKKGIKPEHAGRLERILDRLNAANDIRDMRRKPTHPGEIIKEDYLAPLSMTVKDMSEILGISRNTLSKLINEKGSVSPDLALRLSRAFDTTAEFWLNLQKNHDLWRAEKASEDWRNVKPIPFHLLDPVGKTTSEQVL